MNQDMRGHTFWFWLLGITGAALAMRLIFIDRPSFWIDELYTVMHTTRLGDGNLTKQFGYIPTLISLSLAGALPERSLSENPELWSSLGVTHTLVRLPSAVIGTLTVLLLGWLSRGVIGARAALWFAAFLCVAVWHLHMSQTGRFYVQQLLFYNLGFLLYFRATTIGSLPKLALSMLMLFLGFMSQPPALILGGVIFFDWLLQARTRNPKRLTIPAVFVGAVAAAACFGVLAYDVVQRTDEWQKFGDATSQRWDIIVAGAVWLIGPAAAFVAALGWLRILQRDSRLAVYLGFGAGLPIFAMAVLAVTGQFVHVRYTFIALPAWLMLAAAGVVRDDESTPLDLIGRFRTLAPALLVVIASLLQCLTYYTGANGFRPAWRDAFAYVDERLAPGDIVVGDDHAYWQGRYYFGQDSTMLEVKGTDLWKLLDAEEQRIWIIDKGGAGGVTRWQTLPDRANLQWYFDARALQPFSTVRVFLYEPDRIDTE
ncbi:MAG: glycosyltransferase family 39 protein [Planctomycetota bacterium]